MNGPLAAVLEVMAAFVGGDEGLADGVPAQLMRAKASSLSSSKMKALKGLVPSTPCMLCFRPLGL